MSRIVSFSGLVAHLTPCGPLMAQNHIERRLENVRDDLNREQELTVIVIGARTRGCGRGRRVGSTCTGTSFAYVKSNGILASAERDRCPNEGFSATLKHVQVLRRRESIIRGKVIEEVHNIAAERSDIRGGNKRCSPG